MVIAELEDFKPEEFQNEEQVSDMIDYLQSILIDSQSKDQKYQKQLISTFLNRINDNINDPQSSPKSKLMSVLMMKQITEKSVQAKRKEERNSKFFSMLVTHKLLKTYTELAETIDPYKKMGEKGKTHFQKDSLAGNHYIRVILETIKFWAAKFPQTKTKEPTSYKKNYDKLIDSKLTTFSVPLLKKGERQTERQESKLKSPKEESTPNNPNIKTDVRYMYNKIDGYIAILEEADIKTIQQNIKNHHTTFEVQRQRYDAHVNQILDSGDEKLTNQYFKVKEFMEKEGQAYNEFIPVADFPSYIDTCKLQHQRIFQAAQEQKYPTINEKPKNAGMKRQSSEYGTGRNLRSKIDQPSSGKEELNEVTKVAVSRFFNRLEDKSKSPMSGFRKINDSVSRQKQQVVTKSVKRSVSPVNRSKSPMAKSNTSLNSSRISPIFSNPPNPHVPDKHYEGTLNEENFSLRQALRRISKHQGVRRFKTANFKNKSSLFENEHLQIGFKSEAVYEQISNFKVLIKIEIFIGNLTQQQIRSFSIEYKGDNSLLMYANPKVIDTVITYGFQNKQELMIIPLKVPFPCLSMTIRYNVAGQQNQHLVFMPNTVLKLARYDSLRKSDFNSKWDNCLISKTREFKLCHYLPPDTFKKWLTELQNLTDYDNFMVKGSTEDYELFCNVILLQRYESVLKINIRPNLNVVIQLGLIDQDEEAEAYSTFYLESLEQLIKEVE